MSICTFVRQASGGYDYGHIVVADMATKQEKRTHITLGTAPTYEEALLANKMALAGRSRTNFFDASLRPLGVG